MRWLALVAALALSGCITLPKSTPPPVIPAPAAKCPPLVQYTAAQQNALADALSNLPTNSPVFGFLADYHNLRVADAECIKASR